MSVVLTSVDRPEQSTECVPRNVVSPSDQHRGRHEPCDAKARMPLASVRPRLGNGSTSDANAVAVTARAAHKARVNRSQDATWARRSGSTL
jgi:hypothetical protein